MEYGEMLPFRIMWTLFSLNPIEGTVFFMFHIFGAALLPSKPPLRERSAKFRARWKHASLQGISSINRSRSREQGFLSHYDNPVPQQQNRQPQFRPFLGHVGLTCLCQSTSATRPQGLDGLHLPGRDILRGSLVGILGVQNFIASMDLDGPLWHHKIGSSCSSDLKLSNQQLGG